MILKTWGPEEDQVGGGVFSRCMSFSLDFFFSNLIIVVHHL